MPNFDSEFPLSWVIWHNEIDKLKQLLNDGQNSPRINLELKDARGRTPLMLAVTLGHVECAIILLEHGCDATVENKSYWNVAHEAVATGDPQLLSTVLQYRECHRTKKTKDAMGELLGKLADTPDFYAEMRWEFTSWLPFVSRICPSDTYKVYKRGSTVRIDTTLIGFDSSNQWQRGDQSFIFRMMDDLNSAEMIRIDHQTSSATIERMPLISLNQGLASELSDIRTYIPPEEEVCDRLTAPIITTYIDVDKISFERAKSGIPGWRGDKNEEINGYKCKVYSASNVDLVTKTRSEHLTEVDKNRQESRNNTPFDSLLKFVQGNETKEVHPESNTSCTPGNPCGILAMDYFNGAIDLVGDIGRPKHVTKRCNSFHATLWLSDQFPLSLQEQVTPIIDLMSSNNAHFARLKEFIHLQLPAGFPVKIEIPLFHVINAHITFGNIFAQEKPVPNVTYIKETGAVDPNMVTKSCVIDECVFEIPPNYKQTLFDHSAPSTSLTPNAGRMGAGAPWGAQAEDDLLVQFAIQQSLAPEGSESLAIGGTGPSPYRMPPTDDADLQRAICESLNLHGGGADIPEGLGPSEGLISPGDLGPELNFSGDIESVLEMSRREEEEREKRENERLEEEMRKAIELSLLEQQ